LAKRKRGCTRVRYVSVDGPHKRQDKRQLCCGFPGPQNAFKQRVAAGVALCFCITAHGICSPHFDA
jgi:hypothetical protein